MAISKF